MAFGTDSNNFTKPTVGSINSFLKTEEALYSDLSAISHVDDIIPILSKVYVYGG